MPKPKTHAWIVVADSARASIFAPGEDAGHLIAVRQDLSSPGFEKTSDLTSDRAGRGFSSSRSGTRHGLESRHDPLKMQKHAFVVALADLLDAECGKKAFDSLVLVAPKRTLGELRNCLSERVRRLVGEEIAKDLTKHDAKAVWEHVAPFVNRLAAGLAHPS